MTRLSAFDLKLDYDAVVGDIVHFIKKTVSRAGAKGAVVGLSGGVDSSVVGALCVKALGEANVVGVLMPANHTPEEDMKDARSLAADWDIETVEIEIDSVFSTIVESIPINKLTRLTQANVKARTRMLLLYVIANERAMLVAGTGDRSEDLLGYFTKYGDGGVDFLPISHLYKTQVRALGAQLGLPAHVAGKPASPQLWPGHLATDELPLDYDKLDVVLHCLFDLKLSEAEAAETTAVDLKVIKEIVQRFNASSHKRVYPPMVKDW